MTDDEIIDKTVVFIKRRFQHESTGHDWWHMYRVWQLAKHIAKEEKGVDRLTVELGALLHDIADWKFHDGDMEAGPKEARKWLKKLKVDDSVIEHVEEIIRTVSFKGAGVAQSMATIEGKIIHDADKLDAIGAIGIARAFAYGGAHDRLIYDPNHAPETHADFEAYKNSTGPTINHFSEKLLLLKDRMYTDTAKRLASGRHEFTKRYLKEFHAEWEGEA